MFSKRQKMNMIKGSNVVWASPDKGMDLYNARQYKEMYRSTKFIIDCLAESLDEEKNLSVLDVGCSAGANLLYMARQYPNFSFTGIDINKHYLEEARKAHNHLEIKNTTFKYLNILDLNEKYDIIGSAQTLSFLDFDKGEGFYEKCFQNAKKGVFIFSLFTNRRLEYDITIRDDIYNKAVPYNIHSIKKIEECAAQCGFHLKLKRKFEIDIDLPDIHTGRGTYTIQDASNKRLMFTDVLHLPWGFLYFEKETT